VVKRHLSSLPFDAEDARKCRRAARQASVQQRIKYKTKVIEENEDYINLWFDKCLLQAQEMCQQGHDDTRVSRPITWKFILTPPRAIAEEVRNRLIALYFTVPYWNSAELILEWK